MQGKTKEELGVVPIFPDPADTASHLHHPSSAAAAAARCGSAAVSAPLAARARPHAMSRQQEAQA